MYLERLSKEQQKKFYEEVNITEASLERDVNYLIEWLEKQPHLPKLKNERRIAILLYHCKNSLEKSKRKLDAYFTWKAILPNIFINRDPLSEVFREVFHSIGPIVLPKLTPDGYRITVYRLFNSENDHLTDVNFGMVACSVLDILANVDCFKKEILVYDFRNITLAFAYMTFNMFRKYTTTVLESYAVRIHESHLIMPVNPTFVTLFNGVKSFLPKKMADSINLWTDGCPDFSNRYPPEIIPEEYGGTEKSIYTLRDEFYEYICSLREWFQSEDELVADLSKKPDASYKFSVEEVDGSFRQLAID